MVNGQSINQSINAKVAWRETRKTREPPAARGALRQISRFLTIRCRYRGQGTVTGIISPTFLGVHLLVEAVVNYYLLIIGLCGVGYVSPLGAEMAGVVSAGGQEDGMGMLTPRDKI